MEDIIETMLGLEIMDEQGHVEDMQLLPEKNQNKLQRQKVIDRQRVDS